MWTSPRGTEGTQACQKDTKQKGGVALVAPVGEEKVEPMIGGRAQNREHEESSDDWGGLGVWSEPGEEFQSLHRSSPPAWRANIRHAETLALSLCAGGNVEFTFLKGDT